MYRLERDALEVRATADAGIVIEANGTGLSEQILGAVVDDHRIDAGKPQRLAPQASASDESEAT